MPQMLRLIHGARIHANFLNSKARISRLARDFVNESWWERDSWWLRPTPYLLFSKKVSKKDLRIHRDSRGIRGFWIHGFKRESLDSKLFDSRALIRFYANTSANFFAETSQKGLHPPPRAPSRAKKLRFFAFKGASLALPLLAKFWRSHYCSLFSKISHHEAGEFKVCACALRLIFTRAFGANFSANAVDC